MRVRTGARDAVIHAVVQQLRHDAAMAVRTRGQFVLAIPGGSVAEAVVPPFSLVALPWADVHLLWVDERVVPLSSPDSNAGRALALMAGSPMAQQAHIHTMTETFDENLQAGHTHNPDQLQMAADVYARMLRATAGTPPVLDVALLGVGDDGHVASLFPGSDFINEALQPVHVEYAAPKPPLVRMSLSASVLVRARQVIVVTFGATKSEAMRDALENPSCTTPVAHVLRNAQQVTVVLDHDAARLLSSTTQESIA